MSVLPPPATGPIPWLYQQLWQAQGQQGTLLVYRGAYCPCTTAMAGTRPDPGQGDPNCPLCGGIGLLYPQAPIPVQALVTASISQRALVEAGLAEPGTLSVATPPGGPQLSLWDLCLLPWLSGIASQGQLLTRGSGTTDQTWYRMETLDGVWSEQNGALVTYLQGTDYSWSGRTITWLSGGNPPTPGQVYSVRYGARFEWICAGAPQSVVAWGQDLGQRALLKKRHEVFPSASPVIEG